MLIFFFDIRTILPIAPTSNARGHIIVARIKKTGSSPYCQKYFLQIV